MHNLPDPPFDFIDEGKKAYILTTDGETVTRKPLTKHHKPWLADQIAKMAAWLASDEG